MKTITKPYEKLFFLKNGGFDNDAERTIDLLIYYTLGNENEVLTYDFLAFGPNPSEGIEEDVWAAIKEHEHGEISLSGSKRVDALTKVNLN